MAKEMQALSMAPDDLGEGGAFPADKNLKVKQARVVVLQYGKGGEAGSNVGWQTPSTKNNPVTTGVELVFVDDEGTEYNAQTYSVGEPQKFSPSKDGVNPSDVGAYIIKNPEYDGEVKIPKGSNYGFFLLESVNAGFPANRMKGGNVSEMFGGMYAYFVQKVPKGGGRAERKPVIVPEKVISFGGEKAKGGKAKAEGSDSETVLKKAMKLVKAALKEEDKITKADLAQAAMDTYADDADRDAVASVIFQKEFDKALKAGGYALSGTTITEEE